MDSNTNSNKVPCSAVIVTYNVDLVSFKKNLKKLTEQVETVIIVDNGSDNVAQIDNVSEEYDAESILNKKNMGLANALNQGFRKAKNMGYKWCISMDQDTECPEGMVKTLYKFAGEGIGILCPAVYYEGTEKIIRDKNEIERIQACMTSGSLTRIEAWDKVGGFDESFFIDFIDNDFCMKLALTGYEINRVNSCLMKHHLGDVRERRILGIKKVKYTYHAPVRYYYMIRNNIVFIKRYKNKLNILKEYLKIVFIVINGWYYTTEKLATAKYIMKGIADAAHTHMGELSKV